MTFTTATLFPGLLFLAAGLLFLINNSATVSLIKSFPRSAPASIFFFGAAATWFLMLVRNLGEADLVIVSNPLYLVVFFGVLTTLAFIYIPDFLAVRGLAALILLAYWPVDYAFLGEFQIPQRQLVVAPMMLVVIPLAIWLGAAPYRMRDFLEWLYRTPNRARAFGGLLCVYGAALAVTAFTY